ncbi:MAG: hypothetical protein ABI690_19560 [Chloroflexota bacterium]
MNMTDWGDFPTLLFGMFLGLIGAWIVTALSGGQPNPLASARVSGFITAAVLLVQERQRNR